MADHVIAGVVLLAGAAFVELALRAADQVDCGVVEELTVVTCWFCRRWAGAATGGGGCR